MGCDPCRGRAQRAEEAKSLGAHRVVTSLEDPKGEELGILVRLVADGRLVPRMGLVLDLERRQRCSSRWRAGFSRQGRLSITA